MSKQSNSQKQTVNVTVNNKMACCEKPKKKRKSKPKKPQEEPIMDDEFPVLNTPASSRPSFAPIPIRNTVYMPSSVQISPEGMQPPIPDYFQKHYTNLMRTMEDFQNNIVKEWQDWKQSMQPTVVPQEPQRISPEMTMSEPQLIFDVTPQQSKMQRPTLTMQDAQTVFDISSRQPQSPSTPSASMMTPNQLFEEGETSQMTPVSNLISNFEEMGSPNRAQVQQRRNQLDNLSVKDLQNIYYSKKVGGRGRGRPVSNQAVLINRIIDIEFYGKTF